MCGLSLTVEDEGERVELDGGAIGSLLEAKRHLRLAVAHQIDLRKLAVDLVLLGVRRQIVGIAAASYRRAHACMCDNKRVSCRLGKGTAAAAHS